MSSLPTPISLPIDSDVHRLTVFTRAQVANKQKAIDTARSHATVLLAMLENPFEDLLPQVTSAVLASKLKSLSRSADLANSAHARMVSAAEQGAQYLDRFRIEYADTVKAVDDYGYGKSAASLYPGLQVFPTEIKTLLPFNAREVKRREALLPLRFHGEDLSFQKPPSKTIPGEENENKVAAKTTAASFQKIGCSTPVAQVKEAGLRIDLTIDDLRVNVQEARSVAPTAAAPVAPVANVKQAVARIELACSMPFTIEEIEPVARSTGSGTAATQLKETGIFTESASRHIQTAAHARVQTRAMRRRDLDQADILRYRQEVRGKTNVAGPTTPARTAVALAPPRSRQIGNVVRVTPAAVRDCVPSAKLQQTKTSVPIKALVLKKPTDTKPTPLLEKADVIKPATHQRCLTTGAPQQPKVSGPTKHCTFQDADSDSPGASPCARLDRYGKGNERRISALRTPPLAVRAEGYKDVLNNPSIKDRVEKDVQTIANVCARTPPSTPPPRVRAPRCLV
ncbi:hypothetical protein CF335_g8947, partial [Tilletia laevis]